MKTSTSLEHALHNEKACIHLSQTEEFSDWVITTAFYSALHFVKHRIFPVKQTTEKGHGFKILDFDSYHKAYNPRRLGKHHLLSDLVDEHCESICSEYDRLKDLCWTARYNQYKYDPKLAKLAIGLLDKIKIFCIAKEAKQGELYKPHD